MELQPKPNPRTKPDEDVDLGELFYKTGGVLNSFFSWLGRLFRSLGTAVLQSLFFLRRNLVWLVIGCVIGIAYGGYRQYQNGANYRSKMTVRANFSSVRSLYSTIEQFNALIASGQTVNLAKLLNISAAEAKTLVSFEAQPLKSEIITADMYNDQFLRSFRNTKVRMDTFWTKTITYDKFKSGLTKFDYPIHEITITSNSSTIFPKLQPGIVSQISVSDLLNDIKASDEQTNQEVIEMLKSSIQGLDTLSGTYNRRLANSPLPPNVSSNNITMLDGNLAVKIPELELYDKLLELKDELKLARKEAVIEKSIIQVYSPLGSVGQKENFFEQNVVQYGLWGLLATFLVVLAIKLYKYLLQLERQGTRLKP